MKNAATGPWLGTKQIAFFYSVSTATAYRWLQKYMKTGGEYFQMGQVIRVPESEFTKFLKNKKVAPVQQ